MMKDGVSRYLVNKPNWSQRIVRMFSEGQGQRQMGVKVTFAERIEEKAKYVNKLWYSGNSRCVLHRFQDNDFLP